MGKNLIQQARGTGSPTYRAPSFRYKGEAKHLQQNAQTLIGKIIDLIHCPGHSAPLAKINYSNGETCLMIATDGMKVGDNVTTGIQAEIKEGNTLPLVNLPEGTLIYNLESMPGDGGRFARSSGTFAKIIGKMKGKVVVELPSKKSRLFDQNCRASIGIVSGAGRTEKPFLKAGTAYYYHKARNKKYPHISGAAQNAVDHPFGNHRTSRKSKSRPVSRHAPPGRKVGMISPRRSGRKKK